MKRKIFYLFSMTVLIFISLIFMWENKSEAASDVNPPIHIGVQEFRTNTDPVNMAYGIGNPDANGSTTAEMVGKKLWDFVQYDSQDGVVFDNTSNYYCMNAELGFRDINERETYNFSYDFTNERDKILNSSNIYIKNLVQNEDKYYSLLALMDLMYIPGESTEREKTNLINNTLEAVKIPIGTYVIEITDTDIDAIQQAAIWYFTEQDTELFDRIYNQLGVNSTSWFTYKLQNMEGYRSFSNYNLGVDRAGEQRQLQAVYIYNYLINTAKANAEQYKNGTKKLRSNVVLYVNSSNIEQQPLILIEREPLKFDLSLRKYISKVNDNIQSREPVVDVSGINSGDASTALYNHSKVPVSV